MMSLMNLFRSLGMINNHSYNYFPFRLHGFSRDFNDASVIIYHIKNSHRKHIKTLKESFGDDFFLSNFPPKDLKRIILNYTIDSNHVAAPLVEKQKSIGRCAFPLSMLYMSLLLTSIILSPNKVFVGTLRESGGILMFPLTYVVADIFSENYGYRATRQVIWGAIIALSVATLGAHLCLLLPPRPGWMFWEKYCFVFGKLPNLLYANVVAIIASDYLNAVCFDKLRKLTHGGYLWLRVLGASGIGELSFTVLWVALFYTKGLHQANTFTFMISDYSFKMVYTALFIPISYVAIKLIKKIDSVETHDFNFIYIFKKGKMFLLFILKKLF